MKLSCSIGTIVDVSHSGFKFIIKVQNDNGIFDILSFKEGDQQLKDIAELLKTTFAPTLWVGTRVRLIFGPNLFSESNQAVLYGLGEFSGNTFVVPKYLFESISQKMEKQFYTIIEVYEIAESVEHAL